MSPLERYLAEVVAGEIQREPRQEDAVRYLQQLYEKLAAASEHRQSILTKIRKRVGRAPPPRVRGLYLWGGVGRGKTHLVNGFHESLPFPDKLRLHFHRFMQHIHAELKTLVQEENPVRIVAERLARRARVLCLDEFHVSDIADAMLLHRLLEGLFERGVTLVTTSNIPPDELYRDGLQRERFLPAIELIKEHTRVVNVDGGEDFRLRALERAEIYHYPLDDAGESSLLESFRRLGPENVNEGELLEIEGRTIPTVRTAEGIAWFEFTALCDGPRSTADYIEIARCYHTILLANVPLLGPADNDRALRFIHLVDEFYDRNVNLIVSAEARPEDLYYPEGRFVFQFERTRSRLQEMQSREYLAKTHLS